MASSVRMHLVPAAMALLALGLTGCTPNAEAGPQPGGVPASFPAAGTVILHDSFDSDTNGWGVLDSPEFGTARYENGSYVWHTTGRVASLVPETLGKQFDAGTSMSDVVMKAQVTITKGDGVAGLQCRNSRASNAGYQWYDFVARDGYAAIRRSDDTSNIDVLAETKDVTLPLGKPFTIAGACLTDGSDVRLSLALNDKPLLSTTVPATVTDGAPGLVGWTYPVHSELDVTWGDLIIAKPA